LRCAGSRFFASGLVSHHRKSAQACRNHGDFSSIPDDLFHGRFVLKKSIRDPLGYASLLFVVLLLIAWKAAARAGLGARVHEYFTPAYISFALLVAPIWFFGFGLAEKIQGLLSNSVARVLVAALFAAPYAIFAVPAHQFRWTIQAGFLAICVLGAALLESARRQHGVSRGGWQDLIVLAVLGLAVDLRLFESAWPYPGLSAMSKLVLVNLALYGYLIIRQLDGIGYDLRPKLTDFGIGLREFFFFSPIAIVLGLSLNFLHWHTRIPSAAMFFGGWAFTFLFIAIPEELFFRGLVQNLLERRWGARLALAATSVLFGLSHFNKRLGPGVVSFNWRYVLLATIAGIFYGRAWLARRRVMTSAITHTTVDVVWGIWLR
jgi:membrane protease YdiL (CAAX protease family)